MFQGCGRSFVGFRVGMAMILLGTASSSCTLQQEDGSLIDDAPTSTSSEPLWLAAGVTKWGEFIPVCFTAENGGFTQAQRDRIRRQITDNWGRAAKLQFFGWGNCANPLPTSNQVVVRVDPSISPFLGLADVGKQSGINNVRFPTANPSLHTIVHEFGHTLGFLHEHNDDGTCDARTSGGNQLGTQADVPNSVMSQSACNTMTALSAWDVVGVQNAYGRRVAGSVVGMNAQCLDIPLPFSGIGENLQVFDCNSGNNQKWRRASDGTLFAPSFSPSIVDIETGGSATGLPIQVFSKNSPLTQNQIWNFEGVEIRGIGNLCLDVPNASVFTGQLVQTFPCAAGGASNQRWNVEWISGTSVRIRSFLNPSFCIRAPSGATSGSDLFLAGCGAGSVETFTITALGELRNQGLCWDSEFGDVFPATMQLFTCKADGSGKRNQQYFLRGNIKSGVGTCLATNTTDFTTFSPTQSDTCSFTAPRIWDYYFNP
jgi:hypothetical protein